MSPATTARILLPLACLAAGLPAHAAEESAGGSWLAALSIGAALLILGALLFGRRLRPLPRWVALRRGRRRLRQALARGRRPRLDNFILPGACDGLARVDHAVLTSAGLVCVRARHGNGLVFGSPGAPQWQCVDGVDRRQFLNPLIQNQGRVDALSRIVPGLPVHSVVVFTGRCTFSAPIADNVVGLDELEGWIESLEEEVTTAADLDAAWLSLRGAARTDDASHRDFEAQLSFG